MTIYSNQPYIFDFDKEYEFIGIGKIVGGDTFKKACVANYGNVKGESSDGWGERYKVRLCFRNTKETPDDELIDVIRQTSFPSGHAGLQMYMPLPPECFVNVHKSRFNKQYYITSVIGNTLCTFSDEKSTENCAPKSGFSAGLGGFTVPSTHIDGSKPANEAAAGAPCKISEADKDLQKLNQNVYVPSACRPFDSNAINNSLKNLKKDIEGLRSQLNGPNSALTNAENFLNQAKQKVSEYADKVTGWVKWLIDEIKLRVERGVNWAVNKAKDKLYLNQRTQLQEKKTTALDLIACLFNKILDNLNRLVDQFLNSIINRYVNMATCAIEKFLTELVGQIIGQILSAVNGIINGILGAISGIKGLIDSILNSIISLLDFLSCDVKAECADVTEWNFLEGAASPKSVLNVDSIINSAKSIISSSKSIIDPNNFKFDLDINSMIVGVDDACNVGPILCGPPKISFWGGGGQGANGNAIISAAGEILGVDITSTGFGYSSAPFITFEDACGKGKGATAVVIIGDTPYDPGNTGIGTTSTAGIGTTSTAGIGTTSTAGIGTFPKRGTIVSGVRRVVMIGNGFGYLPKPDGSMGGDERTWSDRCQSKIRKADGTWDSPYNPGEIMKIESGDYVEFAGAVPFISVDSQSVTAPPCPPEEDAGQSPSNSNGNYPVILELDDTEIPNPGFGYTTGDKININPNNGAVLTPEFGYNGQLTGITVVNTGIGFTEVPEIGIDSSTGHNAVIKPTFKILKGDELVTRRTAGIGIINVVDCVGKVP